MAETNENSTQLGNIEDQGGAKPVYNDDQGSALRVFPFDFTQGGSAGDANSTAGLIELPPGKWYIVNDLCRVEYSAFGAGRTLDVGFDAYTEPDGDDVSAVVDYFIDGEDVQNAGSSVFDKQSGPVTALSSRDGITIRAKCLGATLPAAATLKGYVVAYAAK